MTEEARAPEEEPSDGAQPSSPRPRRRRRGGRGRGRGPRSGAGTPGSNEQAETADGATGAEEPPTEKDPADPGPSTPRAKSRPRSRSGSRSRTTSRKPAAGKKAAGDAETPEGTEDGNEQPEADPTAEAAPKRRRSRSRGGRGRGGRAKPAEADRDDGSETGLAAEAADSREDPEDDAPAAMTSTVEAEPVVDEEAPAEEGSTGTGTRRRRRRRRRKKPSDDQTAEAAATGAAAETEEDAPAEERPPPTRTSRATRTRRKGTVTRRRREPMIRPERRTDKVMLITEVGERDQIVVAEDGQLAEHYVTRAGSRSMVGNIYVGRVQNVLPGMEAAFVDVGKGRNAVLYAGEVSYDEEVDEDARRIEQALKPGQSVVVQVTKDPMGGKGARLTGQVSLPGRYLVYVPDGGASGISRRLPEKERNRLRDVLKKIRPSGSGVIVRTAAEGASEEGLAADLERLRKAWDSIKRKSRRGKVPRLIYEEPELTVKVVRDVFSPVEFREIVTDAPAVYERVTAYLEDIAPDLLDKVRLHTGPLSVLEEFRVHEQIHKAIERKVWLPSGGYLIFDRTEAMTVIDVNTGKAVGKTNLEETVVATNLEAAKEIARQLRLRDIGGIIVIDFIDMLLQANRNKVIRALKEEMAQDRTRSQVFDITPLGLLEVTRKRVSAGLVEAFSETCPTCDGRGILVNLEP
ncbi:MAG TPA: Rne/Rng family ribonuclease [Actinomycetota bacterium]|nr:Rne/Rng family ribonuclease [Actinomycetota bacterium]